MITVYATPAKSALRVSHQQARAQTDALFDIVQRSQMYVRPVAERHRIIFYLGHLEAFDWNLLTREKDSFPTFHPTFDRLFAFGIDPGSDQLPKDQPGDWPGLDEVRAYNARVRRTVDALLDDAGEASEEYLHVAIEHRSMHAETLAYMFHNLAPEQKNGVGDPAPEARAVPNSPLIEIPAGAATLGQARGKQFGWDNEFAPHTVSMPAFAISKHKVTNGEYLEFVRQGAPAPAFWVRQGADWFWRTMFGQVPLPLAWPVYVTQAEATAYARWKGMSLPTEAQWHRAAVGTPDGRERLYPWGDTAPLMTPGNFDFRRWDPVAVDDSPDIDSAWGVSQLTGNGWEWTSTEFQPFPGFREFPFYPNYSAPFFDGQHYVLKGGSPRTAACLLRRSFRNWFRPSYPYVYATFRCVQNH